MTIRLMLVVLSTIFLVSLSGCKVAEKVAEINIEDGAILKDGIKPTLQVEVAPQAVDIDVQPHVEVQPGAVKILEGGIHPKLEVQKDAFPLGILRVEEGAVSIQLPKALIEKGAMEVHPGAVVFQPGAIVINLNIGGKGPPLKPDVVADSLSGNLKPLNLKGVDDATKEAILLNEKIYQEALRSLFDMITEYNKTNTTGEKK